MSGVLDERGTAVPGADAFTRPRQRTWSARVATLAGPDVLLLLPLVLAILASAGLQPRLSAVAATALSLALPFALGMAALSVPARIVRGHRLHWELVELGVAAALGLVLLLLLAQLQALVAGLSAEILGVGIVVLGVASWALLRAIDLATRRPDADNMAGGPTSGQDGRHRAELAAVIAVVAIGLAVAVWYRWDSPPPYHPQWDAFAHLRIIDRLLEGFWSPWTTDYSTTFRVNAYFPLQQLTVAIASVLSGVDPLTIYWGGPYVIMPLTGVVAYAVGRSVGAGRVAAVLAGGAVVWAMLPFQAVAFLGLLPLSLAVPFFSVALVAVGSDRSWWTRTLVVLVAAAGAASAHWYIGAAVAAFGIGVIVLRSLESRFRSFWIPATVAVAGIAAVMLLGYAGIRFLPTDSLSVQNPEDRATVRTGSLLSRQKDVELRLSPVVFAASAAGAGVLLAKAARRSRRGPAAVATRVGTLTLAFEPAPDVAYATTRRADDRGYVAATWAATFIVLFVPISGAERAILPALPAILAPTMAWAAQAAFDIARLPAPMTRRRQAMVVLGVAVAAALSSLPADQFRSRQQALAADTTYLSSFDWSERLAGEAVRTLTPRTSFLISDPVTQEILGGLGDREAYGGGPYASDKELRRLRNVLSAPTSRSMWNRLKALSPDGAGPILVAVTGRTADWLAEPPSVWWVGYHQRLARYLDDETQPIIGVLDRLADDRWFQPVWIDPDVVIYAVRPKGYQPVEGLVSPGPEPTDGSPVP